MMGASMTGASMMVASMMGRVWFLAGLAAALNLLLAASPSLAQGAPATKRNIVASFTILADLAREIGGDRVMVKSLVGPNSDAHVYRATPQDAKSLREADLILVNGLGFEAFLPRLITASGSTARLVTASSGIAVLKDNHGGHAHAGGHGAADPHAWQSLQAAKTYISNIRDGLIAIDPAGEGDYRARAAAYLQALDALKAELTAAFAAIPPERRIIITNHDAFAYFAREFGLSLQAVQGVSTDSEPSARDIARIARQARASGARAVFLENISDPRIGAQLAREAGAKLGGTLFSDALTDEKGAAPTYLAMVRANARTILSAIKE